MNKCFIFSLFNFFVVIVVSSCTVQQLERDYFHVSYPSMIGSVNPVMATDLTAYNFLQNIHEGLVTYNAAGDVVYGLLKEIQVSEDGLTYDLFLQDNLYFSDGTPLTAYDVLESWLYVLNPEHQAPFALFFDVIDGAVAYRLGYSDVWRGVQVKNEGHLQVQLVEPFFFFIPLLANPTFAVLSPAWRAGQQDWASVSGAYYITEQERDGSLWLAANVHHYAYSNATMPKIKVSFINNGQVAYQLFKHGALDWQIRNVPIAMAEKDGLADNLVKSLATGSYFVLFNHQRVDYQDVRVRKALSLAINRQELAALLEEKPQASSYLTPFVTEQQRVDELLFDAEQAQWLIRQAGFNTDNPLVIHYRYSSSAIDRLIASYLQASWQALDGVQVELEMVEPARYRSLWASGDFDMIRVSWFVSDYDDASEFLQNFMSHSIFMQMGYNNKHFEQLLQLAQSAATPQVRFSWMLEAEQWLMQEDFAAIGLFFPSNYHLVHSQQWHDFTPSRRDIHLLRYVKNH